MKRTDTRNLTVLQLVAGFSVVLALAVQVFASGVPQLISYQGRLANSLGEPVNTSVSMTFAIYDAPSGGTVLWSETHSSVRVYDGLFNVVLGSQGSPLPDSVFSSAELYLGVTVSDDSELSPRTHLAASSYAHRVSSIEGADLGVFTGIVEIGPAAGKVSDPALIVRGNDADSVVISPVDDITIYSTNDAGDETILMTSTNKGAAMHVTATDIAKGTLRTVEINPGDSIALRCTESTGEDMILITADPGGGAVYVTSTDVAKGLQRTVSMSPRDSVVLSATESNGDQVILITSNPTGGAVLVTSTDVAKGIQRTVGISPRDSIILRATENNGDETILITANPTGGAMYVSATDVAKADPDAIVSTIVLNSDGLFILGSDVSDTSVSVTATGEIASSGQVEVGANNTASGDSSSVTGGSNNYALAVGGTIGGGYMNQVTGDYGTVVGGREGKALSTCAFVGGGYANEVVTWWGVVGGGVYNRSVSQHSTVLGGSHNEADLPYATVGGGELNSARDDHCAVSGGYKNCAGLTGGMSAYCGGGYGDSASYYYSAIGGGCGNTVESIYGTCIGGDSNFVDDTYGFIGGGAHGYVSDYGVVVGGLWNSASGRCAVVGGGGGYSQADSNSAAGDFSTVPGGTANQARGKYSFAAGRRAIVSSSHPGTFLWADSNDVDFNSAAAKEFAARATGGVRFVTAIDGSGNPTAGVTLASGGGSWSSISDRNAKENFEEVNYQELLDRLAAMEMTTWNYKTQAESIRHIGPMAQDFYEAFGVGEDNKHITTIDGIGVVLGAVKGLYQGNQEIKSKLTELDDLKDRLEKLRSLVQQCLTEGQ
jgi:hypothetical protein